MNAIIIFCFYTLNTEHLTNAEFFKGTDCLLDTLACVTRKMETVHNHARAIEGCITK